MDPIDLERLEEETELKAYQKLEVIPVRGEGAYVYDRYGRAFLDFYGGHAVCLTGHCHPRVVEAIRDQAQRLLFYSNTVRSEARARASDRLLAHAPRPGSKVFYVNSGAEANETAMKLARRHTGRRKIVSFTGSFHGRTVATLSACGIAHYREKVAPLLDGHVHVPFGDAAALEAALAHGDVAAVLVEPIQSIGGVVLAPSDYYRAIAALAEAHGALVIFDEVQTGLGRTGTFFFGEHHGVRPHLLTLAKGIASGVPCGAVIVAPEIAAEVRIGDQGSTFGGGHLAMRAVLATLEVIEEERLPERARRMEELLRAALERVPGVRGVRGLGLLLGVDLEPPAAAVQRALIARGVIAGTSGAPHILRLLPPLVIGEREVETFVRALADALTDGRGHLA